MTHVSGSRKKAALLAAVVLAGGTCLAITFFRAEPEESPERERPRERIVRRAKDGPRFLMEVRSGSLPNLAAEENPSPPAAKAPTDVLAGLPLFEASPADFPRIAEDYPAATEEPMPTATAPRVTQHRIVDGDTLASLAARYLGDAQRADELFEANRGVLEHPDLLPIGELLAIPPP